MNHDPALKLEKFQAMSDPDLLDMMTLQFVVYEEMRLNVCLIKQLLFALNESSSLSFSNTVVLIVVIPTSMCTPRAADTDQ